MPILPALMGLVLFSGAISGSVAPAAAPMPVAPTGPTFSVAMTAYNAVPEQTDEDPFTTASGAYSNPEIIAARSRDLKEDLPFGTVIEILGPETANVNCGYDIVSPIMGYRVIADTMHQRFTNRVDVLFSTNANYILRDGRTINASHILGVCQDVKIRVVGRLDPTKMGSLPETQAELAAIITGGGNNLALNK